MTANETPDTITVELPIEAHHDCYVSVTGVVSVSRETWREIAANPNATRNNIVRTVAPAVVAWIERDEWKPLDLPEVGRTIEATLRDGRVETFKVGKVKDDSAWAYVWKADSGHRARFIQRTIDATDHGPRDIIAWDYVDEWKPLDVPDVGRTIKATLRDGRVEKFQVCVTETGRHSKWAGVRKAGSSGEVHHIQLTPDADSPIGSDIIAWDYVDEPAVNLAAIADKIAAAVNELREALGGPR